VVEAEAGVEGPVVSEEEVVGLAGSEAEFGDGCVASLVGEGEDGEGSIGGEVGGGDWDC